MRRFVAIAVTILSAVATGYGYGQCPVLTPSSFGVLPGQTLYYSIDSSLTNAAQGTGSGAGDSPQTQVQNAINSWNTANQSNGTNVTFSPAPPGVTPDITIVNNTTPQIESYTSETTPSLPGLVGSPSNPATITFFAGNPNAWDPSSPGYSSMYLQAALHELGHIMGLGDVDITGLSSAQAAALQADVMNPCVGVNDSGLVNQATSPTPCDNQAANSAAYTLLGSFAGGSPPYVDPGSSGGGDGWGDSPCDWGSDTWDDSTNTVTANTSC